MVNKKLNEKNEFEFTRMNWNSIFRRSLARVLTPCWRSWPATRKLSGRRRVSTGDPRTPPAGAGGCRWPPCGGRWRSDLAGREDLLAEELRIAARALGRLTGRVDVEDILDVIFRDFCIGK